MVVEVRIDNGDWMVAQGTGEWSRDVDISALMVGVHTLRVRAASADSTSGLVFVNFTIGAPDDDTFDLRAWLLSTQGIIFIIVVAVLANVIVIMERGRRTSKARARAKEQARPRAR